MQRIINRNRMVPLVVTTLALVSFANQTVAAAELHEGLVVAAGNGALAMTDIYGQNMRSYMVAPNARILLDGTAARLEDLRLGDHVTVGTRHQDRRLTVITRIDAHSGG